ncbi:MAG TPA: hypothetical protein VFR51_10115 [Pyrinomonadaceae bacterium]|nr:hypothetical protein [Pyrinomonadaceae bacterium]
MKAIPLLLAFLVLSSVVSLAQRPQQPAMQKDRQVLFDFRKERTGKLPRISAATQRMVLSKVFRRYLPDENKCRSDFQPSGDNYLAAARNAGQIVPSIGDVVTGSFTAPGQTETAYVIWTNECGATHADNYGSKRVAIFSGQKLVADVDSDFNGAIVRKTDLNSDGVDELLMSAGDMAQGTVIEIAELVEFRNGKRRVIEDFGTVVEDTCASGFQGSSSKASVLSFSNVEPGKMPKLRIDNYVSSCRNTKRWRFLSTGKMQ